MKLSKFKIFVADDDQFCLFMYRKHLWTLGYEQVTTFADTASFLARLEEEKPDVILLDHTMEKMAGLELLTTVRSVLDQVDIVLVSAQENLQSMITALQAGANEYVFKGETELESITKAMQHIEKRHVPEKRSRFLFL